MAIALLAENSAKSDVPLGHLQSEAEPRAQGLYHSKASLAIFLAFSHCLLLFVMDMAGSVQV